MYLTLSEEARLAQLDHARASRWGNKEEQKRAHEAYVRARAAQYIEEATRLLNSLKES